MYFRYSVSKKALLIHTTSEVVLPRVCDRYLQQSLLRKLAKTRVIIAGMAARPTGPSLYLYAAQRDWKPRAVRHIYKEISYLWTTLCAQFAVSICTTIICSYIWAERAMYSIYVCPLILAICTLRDVRSPFVPLLSLWTICLFQRSCGKDD